VVAVAVRDVDVGQVLAAVPDLVDELYGVIEREERVDQHRVSAAADQRRRVRDPQQRLIAGRDVGIDPGTFRVEHLVLEPGPRLASFGRAHRASFLGVIPLDSGVLPSTP
jgi:hypothetical protein